MFHLRVRFVKRAREHDLNTNTQPVNFSNNWKTHQRAAQISSSKMRSCDEGASNV